MSGHTKTPWKVGRFGGIYPCDSDQYGGPAITTSITKSGVLPNAMANEAFIVKAVNAHEALVEALEEARTFIEDEYRSYAAEEYGEFLSKEARKPHTAICTALALAKGGE